MRPLRVHEVKWGGKSALEPGPLARPGLTIITVNDAYRRATMIRRNRNRHAHRQWYAPLAPSMDSGSHGPAHASCEHRKRRADMSPARLRKGVRRDNRKRVDRSREPLEYNVVASRGRWPCDLGATRTLLGGRIFALLEIFLDLGAKDPPRVFFEHFRIQV